MANFVFDYGMGKAAQLVQDNTNSLVMILMQAVEADATLRTYANLSTLLAATGNTEATFTGYARKTGLAETVTVDTTAHSVKITMPNQTFTAAGGAVNNTLVKVILAVQTATAGDTGLIPLTAHDYSATTNGTNDLVINIPTTGFYSAS
jgi:hypothetical protein